eukprot:1382161-Amorphochlora_amoeboformis.AAC.2
MPGGTGELYLGVLSGFGAFVFFSVGMGMLGGILLVRFEFGGGDGGLVGGGDGGLVGGGDGGDGDQNMEVPRMTRMTRMARVARTTRMTLPTSAGPREVKKFEVSDMRFPSAVSRPVGGVGMV